MSVRGTILNRLSGSWVQWDNVGLLAANELAISRVLAVSNVSDGGRALNVIKDGSFID